MPIYDIECRNCGPITDIWAKIDDLHPACPQCGHATRRLISPPHIICDLTPYFDENLADARKAPQGSYVTSRQDRKRKLKEFGLVEVG